MSSWSMMNKLGTAVILVLLCLVRLDFAFADFILLFRAFQLPS